MARSYPHIAGQFLNAPLAITQDKLIIVASVLSSRLGIDAMSFADGNGFDVTLDREAMQATAAQALADYDDDDDDGPADTKSYMVQDGVAVIPIEGTLVKKHGLHPESGMTGYDGVTWKLRAARADNDVGAILLGIDSPGGVVNGINELAEEIYAFNGRNGGKPIYAVADGDAMSAAYWAASSADKVFVTRLGGVGSISCVALYANENDRLKKDGIHVEIMRPPGADQKMERNPIETLSADARARWQEELADAQDVFIRSVARGRNMPLRDISATQGAAIRHGKRAVELGFADDIASFSEAFLKLRQRLNRK